MRRWMFALLFLGGCAADNSYISRNFENYQHRKFVDVTRQAFDFTCGAASLATLAHYYFDKPVTEKQVADIIKASYSEEEWQEKERNGLSLLDLKKAAIKLGFEAEGVKLSMADLNELNGPIIVHLAKSSIQHFSVLRGVKGDRVMLADPVFGNSRMPVFEFGHEWSGYGLAVWIEDAELPKGRLTIKAWETPTETDAVHQMIYVTPPPPIPYPQS